MIGGNLNLNRFSKQNVILPFSLHDARITSIEVKPATTNLIDGRISFKFANGYCKVNEHNVQQTGKGSVIFSGIDFDYSHVYYCKENKRKEITFEQLAEDVEKSALDIIDETYGCNLSKFSCTMVTEDAWYEVEIEIYHFNETIYEWEDYPIK